MYQRSEDDSVKAFYELYADWTESTPQPIAEFVDGLAQQTSLTRAGSDFPTDTQTLLAAAEALVDQAANQFSFELDLQSEDDSQLDCLIEEHLIDEQLRGFFAAGKMRELSEEEIEEFCTARDIARIPNEPLLYYCLGAFWGEWQIRHRQAVWTLYEPLNPVQSFPDMLATGATICSHPFSQVCKKMSDPEGDQLAFKAKVTTTNAKYLPPFPLLASLMDAQQAIKDLMPEPAQRAMEAVENEQDEEAWELFCEGAMEDEQPQLLANMISCAWRLEKFDLVDGVSQRLLELVPDHPTTCHNLAVLYANNPEYMDEAIDLLQRALTSYPAYARARMTLASCYREVGREDEAVKLAQWVVENDQELKTEAESFIRGEEG